MLLLILNLFYSLKIMIDMFAASISTILFACYITGTPLWNPQYSFDEFEKKVADVVKTNALGFAEAICVTDYFLSYRFIQFGVTHTWIGFGSNVIGYVLLVEAFHYGYHRYMHTPYFFKRVHSKHHEARHVYPIDTFYMSYIDVTMIVVVLSLPVFFLSMNITEYSLVVYSYITGGFLLHSNMIVKHHAIHHKKMKGNFCFLFPIYDYLFGTMIEE